MTQKFDKLITEAAPAVPDCGPSRRTARTLLHERMRRQRRQRRVRNRWGLSLAASLAFGLMFMGQVQPVGSDNFGVKESGIVAHDSSSTVLASDFGPLRFDVPKSWNAGQIRELRESMAAREGRVLYIRGIMIAGKTVWTMKVERVINGEAIISGREIDDPPSELSKFHVPFFRNHIREANRIAKTTAPKKHEIISVNGVPYNFGVWEFDEPDIGSVAMYWVDFR